MKYDILAQISYKIKSSLNKKKVKNQIHSRIRDIFSKSDIPRFDIKIFIKANKNEATTYKEFSWHKIKNEIDNENNTLKTKLGTEKINARMNRHRYFTFKENNKCVCCGIEGKKILLEKNPTDQTPHLNLYAHSDNKLILITKDHIYPKSLGGTDTHSNYQTMCSVCNSLKGHSNLRLIDLIRLRKIYDKNRGKTKKKLHEIIERERLKIKNGWKLKSQKQRTIFDFSVKTLQDLSIYKNRNGILIAKSIFDKNKNKDNYVGNVRKGTILQTVFVFKNHVECHIKGSSLVVISKSLIIDAKEENEKKFNTRTMGN